MKGGRMWYNTLLFCLFLCCYLYPLPFHPSLVADCRTSTAPCLLSVDRCHHLLAWRFLSLTPAASHHTYSKECHLPDLISLLYEMTETSFGKLIQLKPIPSAGNRHAASGHHRHNTYQSISLLFLLLVSHVWSTTNWSPCSAGSLSISPTQKPLFTTKTVSSPRHIHLFVAIFSWCLQLSFKVMPGEKSCALNCRLVVKNRQMKEGCDQMKNVHPLMSISWNRE